MNDASKTCRACHENKPLTKFRAPTNMGGRHVNKCRACENGARNSRRNKLSADVLRSLIHYDPDTGIFTRIKRSGQAEAGDTAGTLSSSGYLRFSVENVTYAAHRLAWLYMTGQWPQEQIDHRDLNKQNNAWANLREATAAQNTFNRRRMRNNKLGIKGVVYRRRQRKWMAHICLNGLVQVLGYFSTPDEAAAAYAAAARKLHGEFARVS